MSNISLQDVASFLETLCVRPKGCPVKELLEFSSLGKITRSLDYNKESLGHFIRSLNNVCDLDKKDGTSFVIVLLEQGLLNVVKILFEDARDDLEWKSPRACSHMLDIMDIICAMSDANMEAKMLLAETFSGKFLYELLRETDHLYTMEVVKSINLLIERCSFNCRQKLLKYRENTKALERISQMIYTAGDYEIQAGIIECLLRFTPRSQRKKFSRTFFSDSALAKIFVCIKDGDFEVDCRQFLNRFNSELKTKINVFSLPCVSVQLGMQKLKKPSDADFWVDFNPGPARMSLVCEKEISDSQGEDKEWDNVSVWKKDLRYYNLNAEKTSIVLTLSLKSALEDCIPGICAGQKETYGSLTFDPSLVADLTEALNRCYGKELMYTALKKSSSASVVVTPLRIKTQHQSDEISRRVNVVRNSLESRNEVSRVKESTSQTSQKWTQNDGKPQSTGEMKIKSPVPVEPMITPARLTTCEIRNSGSSVSAKTPVGQPDRKVNSPLKEKIKPVKFTQSSCDKNIHRESQQNGKNNPVICPDQKARTPSKLEVNASKCRRLELNASKCRRSHNVDNENGLEAKCSSGKKNQISSNQQSNATDSPRTACRDGETQRVSKNSAPKTKDMPTPKTPIGRRTRSGVKNKTPLVLQTTDSGGNRKKKRSVKASPGSETEENLKTKKRDKCTDVFLGKSDKNLYPDLMCIPDSLPIDRNDSSDVSIEKQNLPGEEQPKKALSDRGISAFNLSDQMFGNFPTEDASLPKDIHVVSQSVTERRRSRRQCGRPKSYKDLSSSDGEETDEEKSNKEKSPELDDTFPAIFEAREEISWIGKQKFPAKVYTSKAVHRFGYLKSPGKAYSEDEKWQKWQFTPPKQEKTASRMKTYEDQDDLHMDHILDSDSEMLTLTPLKTDDFYKDISDEMNVEEDQNRPSREKSFEGMKLDSDDVDGRGNTSWSDDEPETLSSERNSCNSNAETRITWTVSPISDDLNNDLAILTPLDPLEEAALPEHRMDELNWNLSSASGPSSTVRLTKSEAKRKYKDILESESESHHSDTSTLSPFHPRKLFKQDIKDTKMMEPLETTDSVRSFSSNDSLMHMEVGDMLLQDDSSSESVMPMEMVGMSFQDGLTTFINKFGRNFQTKMKEKSKMLSRLMGDAVKTTQDKLNVIWTQHLEKRDTSDDFMQNVLIELKELERDMCRLHRAEEEASKYLNSQMLKIQKYRKSQEQRVRKLKRLHLSFNEMGRKSSAEQQLQLLTRDNQRSVMNSLREKLLGLKSADNGEL